MKPCCECMASAPCNDVCGLYCRLWGLSTVAATKTHCRDHVFHLNRDQYLDFLLRRLIG